MRQEISEIIASLAQTPEAVRRLREGIVADDLRMRADDGNFSFVEHVCHLRDIEREGYGARIERILNEESPSLATDPVQQALVSMIRAKQKHGRRSAHKTGSAKGGNVVDLMAVLKKSLQGGLPQRG